MPSDSIWGAAAKQESFSLYEIQQEEAERKKQLNNPENIGSPKKQSNQQISKKPQEADDNEGFWNYDEETETSPRNTTSTNTTGTSHNKPPQSQNQKKQTTQQPKTPPTNKKNIKNSK